MDAEKLALPDDSFDVVVAQYVITAVPNPEATLDEFARVLKPGGEIVLVNHIGAEEGPRRLFEQWFAPIARRLGWRPEFRFGRLARLGRAPRRRARDRAPRHAADRAFLADPLRAPRRGQPPGGVSAGTSASHSVVIAGTSLVRGASPMDRGIRLLGLAAFAATDSGAGARRRAGAADRQRRSTPKADADRSKGLRRRHRDRGAGRHRRTEAAGIDVSDKLARSTASSVRRPGVDPEITSRRRRAGP